MLTLSRKVVQVEVSNDDDEATEIHYKEYLQIQSSWKSNRILSTYIGEEHTETNYPMQII